MCSQTRNLIFWIFFPISFCIDSFSSHPWNYLRFIFLSSSLVADITHMAFIYICFLQISVCILHLSKSVIINKITEPKLIIRQDGKCRSYLSILCINLRRCSLHLSKSMVIMGVFTSYDKSGYVWSILNICSTVLWDDLWEPEP